MMIFHIAVSAYTDGAATVELIREPIPRPPLRDCGELQFFM